VNGQDIQEDKLQKAVDAHLQQQGTNVGAIRDPKKYKEVREKVLDVLIGQKLLWQSARKNNLVASDEEVDNLYKNYAAKYPSQEEFNKRMGIEGYDEKSYREELRQQLSAKKWVHENVIKAVKVEAGDIHAFYESNAEKFLNPEMVRARHILIVVDKNATDKDRKAAKKLLGKLKRQIAKGEDFAELAKKHSKDGSAAQGGDLGAFPRGAMVKPFEDAAFALKAGEVSDIVETQFGYHLIKVEEKQASRKVTEAEVAGRIEQYLLKTRAEEALNKALDALRKTAKIEKHIF